MERLPRVGLITNPPPDRCRHSPVDGRAWRCGIIRCLFGGRTVLLVLFLLNIAFSAHARSGDDLVVERPQGFINWTRGFIQVTAVKVPILNAEMTAVAAAAEAEARKKLAAVVYDLPIDAFRRVRDLDTKKFDLFSGIRKLISEVPIHKQQYLSDGTAQITLRLNLTGALAQLLLPSDIRQIEVVRTVKGVGTETSADRRQHFSGLLVDARGIGLQPAMTPSIIDENGLQIYGEPYASREFAVQRGMCRYFRNLEAARQAPRVAGRPLIIRGLRTAGPGKTNIVISNADTDKIRSASEHLVLLRQCRVVIVVD